MLKSSLQRNLISTWWICSKSLTELLRVGSRLMKLLNLFLNLVCMSTKKTHICLLEDGTETLMEELLTVSSLMPSFQDLRTMPPCLLQEKHTTCTKMHLKEITSWEILEILFRGHSEFIFQLSKLLNSSGRDSADDLNSTVMTLFPQLTQIKMGIWPEMSSEKFWENTVFTQHPKRSLGWSTGTTKTVMEEFLIRNLLTRSCLSLLPDTSEHYLI